MRKLRFHHTFLKYFTHRVDTQNHTTHHKNSCRTTCNQNPSVKTDMQGRFEASCSHTRTTKNQRCPIKTPNPRLKNVPKKLYKPGSPKRTSIVELHRPNHELPYQSIVPKKYKSAAHFLVRLADPKIGPRKLRHLLFPLTQNGGSKNKAAYFQTRSPFNLQGRLFSDPFSLQSCIFFLCILTQNKWSAQ